MASSYESMVGEAIVLLEKFNAGSQCLDDFIKDASKDLQNMDAEQKTFILDLVSGCAEHQRFLDVVVNVFYGQNRNWLSKSDHSQIVIVCYITTFILGDIGLQNFSNIVNSLDIKKMHTFLHFFFTNLTTWIREEWNHIYDPAFVEKQWIGPLIRWRPGIDIIMDQLADKISDESQFTKPAIKTTVPQEFCLNKTRPRPPATPDFIPQPEKFKPVPASTYKAPKMLQIIEDLKEKNQQKSEELLYEANMKQFRCGNPQKSERTKRVIAQIEEDMDSKLKFNSFHSSGLPASNKTNNQPIKLNRAAILKQGALHDSQLKEELQRIERLVAGAQEASSFLQWQKEMQERDRQEELAKIELKHMEGQISYKEAAMARTRIMERNQKTAQLSKEETAQLMRIYARKRLQEEKEMRDLAQQVSEGHKNSKIAKEKMQMFKQTIVKEVSGQSRELLRQALEEEQAELSRKCEIIAEIHSIESLPRVRVKYFDDTETAGYGALGEMSLAELKLRLARLKEEQKAEEEERREQILQRKQEEKQLLLEYMETIALHRETRTQAAALRKEEKKKNDVRIQQALAQDKTLLALQRKFEEKKQEWERLKQVESSKVKATMQPSKNTELPTKMKTKNLTKGTLEELESRLKNHIQQDGSHAVFQRKTYKT